MEPNRVLDGKHLVTSFSWIVEEYEPFLTHLGACYEWGKVKLGKRPKYATPKCEHRRPCSFMLPLRKSLCCKDYFEQIIF
jgi:hypothetical protein